MAAFEIKEGVCIIPSGVTEIGVGAFLGCSGLKSVNIMSKANLPGYMFYECTSLEIVTLPVGIKKIECDVFWSCSNLKTIYVPAKKVDYYKKRLSVDFHSLIVELPAEKKTKTKK